MIRELVNTKGFHLPVCKGVTRVAIKYTEISGSEQVHRESMYSRSSMDVSSLLRKLRMDIASRMRSFASGEAHQSGKCDTSTSFHYTGANNVSLL
jgi:hypothetical protein